MICEELPPHDNNSHVLCGASVYRHLVISLEPLTEKNETTIFLVSYYRPTLHPIHVCIKIILRLCSAPRTPETIKAKRQAN